MKTSSDHRIFIVNLEKIVGDGPVTGAIATKNAHLMPRYMWYGLHFDTVVLTSAPPPEFVEYVKSFGLQGTYYVPKNLNPRLLTVLDGFKDPVLTALIPGSYVDSYVPDVTLAGLVQSGGGTYAGSTDDRAIHLAGDKHHFAELSAPLVIPPPGQLYRGIYNVTRAVLRRLANGQGTFVRITRAGGGLGNHIFRLPKWKNATEETVAKELGGKNPELWKGAYALVEDILELKSSHGVAFHTLEGLHHTTLQITRGGDFCGCWIPCPPSICPPETVTKVVNHFTNQLTAIGYHGHAQTDLGIDTQDNHYGFEINARFTGGMHAKFILDLVGATAAKSIDAFHLATPLTFTELQTKLSAANLLASPQRPEGVVISIPPHGAKAGVVVVGPSYQAVADIYDRLVVLVGHPTKNTEDHPFTPA